MRKLKGTGWSPGKPNYHKVVIQVFQSVYGTVSFKNRQWLRFLIVQYERIMKGGAVFNRISNTCSLSGWSPKEMQFSKMSVVGNSGQNNNFLQIHPRLIQWPFQLA